MNQVPAFVTVITSDPADPLRRLVRDDAGQPLADITIDRDRLSFRILDGSGQPVAHGGVAAGTKMLKWRAHTPDGRQIVEYHTTVTLSVRITVRDGADYRVHGNRPLKSSWSLTDAGGHQVLGADVEHAYDAARNRVTITHDGRFTFAEVVSIAELLRLSRESNSRRINLGK